MDRFGVPKVFPNRKVVDFTFYFLPKPKLNYKTGYAVLTWAMVGFDSNLVKRVKTDSYPLKFRMPIVDIRENTFECDMPFFFGEAVTGQLPFHFSEDLLKSTPKSVFNSRYCARNITVAQQFVVNNIFWNKRGRSENAINPSAPAIAHTTTFCQTLILQAPS